MTVAEAPARIVLDTNVVLDWLVFKDSLVQPIVDAIEQGQVQWVASAAMRSELHRTLGCDSLARWSPDSEQALAVFDRRATLLPMPPTLPSVRCSDPDDQVFLDLSVAAGSRWLFTHDRALLRLARLARRLGVAVLRPADWGGVTVVHGARLEIGGPRRPATPARAGRRRLLRP